VVYMPYIGTSQEFKSKPAQNSVRELRGFGITPDILAARSETPAPESSKAKLSLFSGIPEDAIALLPNAPSIYQVPLRSKRAVLARWSVSSWACRAGDPDWMPGARWCSGLRRPIPTA